MAIISVVYILLCLASPIVVISLIVFIIVKKNNKGKNDTSFKNVIKSIYVYLCLCIFLCMSITSIICAVNTGLNYFLPEINMDKELSETLYIQNSKNEDCVNMITSIGALAISLPMFIYHIKLSKEER